MTRIFSLGELLVDMTGTDNKGLKEGKVFEKNAGGAAANVCAAASMLGADTYFMGQVGSDSFGDYLISKLQSLNVDTSMVVKGGNTSMAFVSVNEKGERDFTFLRDADMKYDFRNIKLNMIDKNDILNFSSATGLLDSPFKKTYINFLYYGKENKNFMTFDPNYRDSLLPESSLPQYKKDCMTFIKNCDFVKMSLDEMRVLTDCDDYQEGALILIELGAKVVCITMADKGAFLCTKDESAMIETIPVKQIDSTGAGDAFMGGILYQLTIYENRKELTFDIWKEVVKFANICGALTTTKYGAMEGIPTIEEVEELLV